MSGDVQPRKRKDKNKKKKEDDIIFTRNEVKEPKEPTPVGVHAGAMGPDDVHLHVHKDHGVGGNFCVKIVFFSLLAILLGIAGLILLENRGVSDVDTPVTESRFQEYFEGWVEEKQESHDEHDHIVETLNNSHDDHDDDEGHDNGEQDDTHSGEDHEEEDHEDEADEQSNEVQSGDKTDEIESNEDEGIEADARNGTDSDEEQDPQNSGDDENEDNQIEPEDDLPELIRSKRSTIFAEAFKIDNDDDNDDSADDFINPFNEVDSKKSEEIMDQQHEEELQHSESNDDDEDSNDNTIVDNTPIQDENDDSHENFSDDTSPFQEHVVNDENIENSFNSKSTSNYPINKKPDEEEDEDDGSFEDDKFFENDSGEDLHLEKLSKQEEKIEEPEVPQSSSLTVKLIVGLALVGVAAQVFARRSTTNDDDDNDHVNSSRKMEKEDSYDELSMKRRLTIADDEVAYDDDCDDYEDEYDGDEGDEVEYDDDEEYEENVAPAPILKTFEQFDAFHKEKAGFTPAQDPIKIVSKDTRKLFETSSKRFEPPIPAALLSKSEPVKLENTLRITQNLTTRTDEFKKEISPVTLTTPKQSSPILQKQSFMTLSKQPSPTPQKQPSPIPQKQPSPIPAKQPSPTPPKQATPIPPNQPSPTPLRLVETISAGTNLIPDVLPKPSSVFQPYHRDDEDDDEEYGDEDDEEYSGDEDEEAEDEEDISDVDDSDLLKRLDEKYGKLPNKPVAGEGDDHGDSDVDEDEEQDKSWTKLPARSGPQSVNDDEFDNEIHIVGSLVNNNPNAAFKKINTLIKKYPQSPELLFWKAISLDRLSEINETTQLLDEAIENYQAVLEYGSQLNDSFFKLVGEKCIKRIHFRGILDKAITSHEKLINRFPDEPKYQNELAVTYILLHRAPDAKQVLDKVLQKWQNNGFALVHYGLMLKNFDKNYVEAVEYLKQGIASREEGTNDGQFYYHLGDALCKLHRTDEARKIYKQGAARKFFISENQRSIYNVDRLKSHPFWTKQETTYETQFNTLERNWNIIRQEGLSVLNENGLFQNEDEDLTDTGIWKQFYLFVSGRRLNKNCEKTPITCKLLDTFPAAKHCSRGHIKFSVMQPKTHIWPHCGPTNSRLRAHLGLTVPTGTYLRVGEEIRSWQEGQFLIFDDSFEHEVWHNGTAVRLILIIDVWHPDLTSKERSTL